MTAIALTRRALRGKGPFVVMAIAAVALFAVPAAAQTSPPTADMGVVSLTPSRADRGPGHAGDVQRGGQEQRPGRGRDGHVPPDQGRRLVNEVCQAVSPDTPFCEYGEVPAGTSLTAKFVVKVTATHGT